VTAFRGQAAAATVKSGDLHDPLRTRDQKRLCSAARVTLVAAATMLGDPYWITSSARNRIDCGTLRPSPRGFEIDREVKISWVLPRQVTNLGTVQQAIYISGGPAKIGDVVIVAK
jgi:hypothetical protein